MMRKERNKVRSNSMFIYVCVCLPFHQQCVMCVILCVWVQVCPCLRVPPLLYLPLTHPTLPPFCVVDIFLSVEFDDCVECCCLDLIWLFFCCCCVVVFASCHDTHIWCVVGGDCITPTTPVVTARSATKTNLILTLLRVYISFPPELRLAM